MSSFELNKVIGAVLVAVLTMVVIGKIGDNLVTTGGGHGGGHGGEHASKESTVTAKAKAPKKKAPLEPIVGMLASADVAAGQKVFGKCKSCHTVTDGGKNGIGPNLWNVVNAARGAKPGFGYSKAMSAKPGNWTYGSLNAFLAKPKTYIKGTKMTFAGLGKTKDRANVIAYLRSAAATPAPLPSQADIDKAVQALEAAKQATADADRAVTDPVKKAVSKVEQAAAAPAMAKQNIVEMLASADAARGKKVFGKCKACHTVKNGGKNGIGPNLWNVVNRAPAAVDGFKYSNVLKGLSGKPWNYENLNAFLMKPKAYAKGTKMTFAGLKKDSDRANLIAYLRGLSDSPAPLK